MSTPQDAFQEAFRRAFGDVWSQASLMILAIIMLLGFCAGLAIWLEWKFYGQRR